MFDFLKIKNALVDLGGQMATLRKDKETLMRKREDLVIAPGTKADVIAMFHAHIDEHAAHFPQRLRQAIESNSAFGRDPHRGPDGKPQFGVLSQARRSHHNPCSATDLEESLYFILGPAIKKATADAINAMDWPAEAAPLADRAAQLAKLDKEIGELEQAEAEMRSAATAAGVIV